MRFAALAMAALAALPAPAQEAPAAPFVTEGVTHPGGDQIYWVPTYAQAEEMSRATGRPIFVMGGV
jgi:hypothetical protein